MANKILLMISLLCCNHNFQFFWYNDFTSNKRLVIVIPVFNQDVSETIVGSNFEKQLQVGFEGQQLQLVISTRHLL